MIETTTKPQNLHCESGRCRRPAEFVYGPECEAETGKLMYLCGPHGQFIADWKAKHPNEPVTCKEHGVIGPVKSYLILKEMPRNG